MIYVWTVLGSCEFRYTWKTETLNSPIAGVYVVESCFIWVLGSELQFSVRSVGILNSRALSPVPREYFSIIVFWIIHLWISKVSLCLHKFPNLGVSYHSLLSEILLTINCLVHYSGSLRSNFLFTFLFLSQTTLFFDLYELHLKIFSANCHPSPILNFLAVPTSGLSELRLRTPELSFNRYQTNN